MTKQKKVVKKKMKPIKAWAVRGHSKLVATHTREMNNKGYVFLSLSYDKQAIIEANCADNENVFEVLITQI